MLYKYAQANLTLVRRWKYRRRGGRKKKGHPIKQDDSFRFTLRRERIAAGLSMYEAAKLTGLSRSMVNSAEVGYHRAGRSVRFKLMGLYIRIREESLQASSMQNRLQVTANS